MKRRAFGTLWGGTAVASTAWPALPGAQPKAMPRIGWLSANAPVSPANPFAAAFREGLGEAGYVEGRNVAFDYRWAEGHYDRLPAMAADLVGRKVDVIVAIADPAAHAAKTASRTIPIVFLGGDDPVAAGLGASLARPGGNLTGVTVFTGELNPKRLELLREVVPKAAAVALLVNPDNQATGRVIREMREATRSGGLQLHILEVSRPSGIDAAFTALVERQAGALLVDADVLFLNQQEQIVALAARHAVPAMYGYSGSATAGGLISYATKFSAAFRQDGVYAGKILMGTQPADLPVQQPTTFELVINMKTAKALGVTIPPSILARADEVIE